jgi:hypothetical protein
MTEHPQDSPARAGKKKGVQFLGYFSALLSFTIVCAGLIWEIYSYYPQYYFIASFSLLGVAAVVAYVILTKSIKIS